MTHRTFARFIGCTALAGVALATLPVQAQTTAPPIKPGLWQVHTDRLVDGQKAPDLGEHLKKMTPEMRRRMEANMKQHGVDMSGGAGTMKLCMTRESLDQGRWQGEQGACKTDFSTRSGSRWAWRSVCTQPPSETEGEAAFANPENYTVKTRTSTARKGQASVMQMTMKARWLGADCGDLKPVTAPKMPASAKPKP